MYCIIEYSAIEANIEKILPHVFETSVDSLRHTTSGVDKVILKWKPLEHDNGIPRGILTFMNVNLKKLKAYTYDEIREELKKPEWQSDL
jgi:hypothetical protein